MLVGCHDDSLKVEGIELRTSQSFAISVNCQTTSTAQFAYLCFQSVLKAIVLR